MRKYLKQLRNNLQFTQQDVADKLGISLSYYNLIENGDRQRNMDIITAARLARILGVTVEFIISEEAKLARENV